MMLKSTGLCASRLQAINPDTFATPRRALGGISPVRCFLYVKLADALIHLVDEFVAFDWLCLHAAFAVKLGG